MTHSLKARTVKTLAATAVLVAATLSPLTASARTIEKACMASDRAANNVALCGCIQQVADMTLTNSDQRQAAKFFEDPQKAQDIRQSDKESHEAFWLRYKEFGNVAAEYCG
ncbi:hypothetical protein [Celeribacter litoreus]|uniref:hypothetical protein n=1 Tax=Celeribacter litoreus TaxID=2876714 RepID=UPI001CC92FBA|nr:hypothetical protein [Celeribacter litoreus]MCA0042840.1 hypothetical protein [Celeribacter litoreus]